MDFRAKQEAEAVERMKLLELYPTVIKEFINEKVINKSEHIGILYWLDEDEYSIQLVRPSLYSGVSNEPSLISLVDLKDTLL